MRQQQPKEKIQKRVEIPADLTEFFVYVNSLIESGDEIAFIESDDLIQNEYAYGGLINEGMERYYFSYFPERKRRPKWELEVIAEDIHAIANGTRKHLEMWGCVEKGCGNLFSSPEELCFYCDYIDDERDARENIFRQIADSPTREEWVRAYLKHYPNSHPFQIIGAYNSQEELGKKWGFFSLQDMEVLIARFTE